MFTRAEIISVMTRLNVSSLGVNVSSLCWAERGVQMPPYEDWRSSIAAKEREGQAADSETHAYFVELANDANPPMAVDVLLEEEGEETWYQAKIIAAHGQHTQSGKEADSIDVRFDDGTVVKKVPLWVADPLSLIHI